MIPRVVTSPRTAGWARKTVSAFERGPQERALCMFIDDASLSSDDLATSMVRGFVGHPLLEVFTTAPTADPHLEVEKADGPYPNDVARVFTIGTKQNGAGVVRCASQKAHLAARYATQDSDLGELTRSILLADYAELHGADAFVTSSAELKAMAKDGPYAGANIMSPKEAVALVGLFLRLRHDFAYLHSGKSKASYGKPGFYGLLAKDLLPASRRWLAVCPDGDPLQSSSFKLAWSVLIRVERACTRATAFTSSFCCRTHLSSTTAPSFTWMRFCTHSLARSTLSAVSFMPHAAWITHRVGRTGAIRRRTRTGRTSLP